MVAATGVIYEPFGKTTWRNPFDVYRRLRDEDPVHHVANLGFWIATRFEDVFTAARDPETFSSAEGVTIVNELEELGLGPTILQSDAPVHTRYRRVVGREFTPRRVHHLEDALRRVVRERLDVMRQAGRGDFIEDFAVFLPGFAMCHYLDVPEADRRQFEGWVELFVRGGAGGHDDNATDALDELRAYLAELIAERSQHPGDDLLSAFIAPADNDSDEFTLEEILGFVFVFISGGTDTIAGALGGTAELLTRHPDQRQKLVDHPTLVPGAVEEFLRLTSPAQGLARKTTRATTLSGTELPQGARLLLCYGAANRDDREFGPTADDLDVTRAITRALTFGSGAHFCLGAAVARLQMQVAVEELVAVPAFSVDFDAGEFADGMFVRRYETLPYSLG